MKKSYLNIYSTDQKIEMIKIRIVFFLIQRFKVTTLGLVVKDQTKDQMALHKIFILPTKGWIPNWRVWT